MLTWILSQPGEAAVVRVLRSASAIVTSELTLVECDRALIRLRALDQLPEGEVAERGARLAGFSTNWAIMSVSSPILDRARQPFPVEPIRALDALHLSSALLARHSVEGLAFLSLDEKLRRSSRELGFPVLPVDGERSRRASRKA